MKIGILGAGKIAAFVVETLRRMDGVELAAVAARDLGRAKTFAADHGVQRAYGSYLELAEDVDVELIYITTTIAQHREHMRLCIEHGKAVMCEKAFTLNAKEAREVLDLAKSKGVFVAEAIWPRYMPMQRTLRDLVQSGKLGEIQSLTANLGYPVSGVPRLTDPALGGGSLLDIGIYPLTFASICFGDDIVGTSASAKIGETGVDLESSIELRYADGRRAYIMNTCLTPTDRTGVIYGDQGYAVVENTNNYESVAIFNAANEMVERIERPEQITGYEYQFECAIKAIDEGKIECAEMPHSETIRMMELMDTLRAQMGVKYPGE